jgi:hypothetical protein
VQIDFSQTSAGGEGRVSIEPGIHDHHTREGGSQFTGQIVGNHQGITSFGIERVVRGGF